MVVNDQMTKCLNDSTRASWKGEMEALREAETAGEREEEDFLAGAGEAEVIGEEEDLLPGAGEAAVTGEEEDLLPGAGEAAVIGEEEDFLPGAGEAALIGEEVVDEGEVPDQAEAVPVLAGAAEEDTAVGGVAVMTAAVTVRIRRKRGPLKFSIHRAWDLITKREAAAG